MDSKWKEEKAKRDEREANKAYSGADDITQNLRRFASKRPDIFGKQQEVSDTQPNQQAQQATVDPANPIIWDGQSQSITRTTANIAMMRNQQ